MVFNICENAYNDLIKNEKHSYCSFIKSFDTFIKKLNIGIQTKKSKSKVINYISKKDIPNKNKLYHNSKKYNNCKYIERTIESILNQEGVDSFEIVVIDNASTDETARARRPVEVNIKKVRRLVSSVCCPFQ